MRQSETFRCPPSLILDIRCDDPFGATPLRLKTPHAIPTSDIENRLSSEIDPIQEV